MEKKKALLVQLPQPGEVMGNIPMAPSLLKSAIHSSPINRFVSAELYEARTQNLAGDRWLILDIIGRKPDIIGFTAYIWNIERILHIASHIRQALPEATILLGGPESVAESTYISQNPSIDFWVFGEGEEVVVEILSSAAIGKKDFGHIRGIAWWEGTNLRIQPGRNICRRIDTLPTPYLSGDISESDFPVNILFTCRGCTRVCKYCCWGSRGALRPVNIEFVKRDLDIFHRGATKHVVIGDSAFNESPLFFEVCDLIARINYDNRFKITCFISPDTLTAEQAESLTQCRMAVVEIGLQSANPEISRAIGRPLNLERFIQCIRLLRNYRISFLVDVILGLPMETPETFHETIDFIKKLDLPYVVYPLSVGQGCRLRREIERYGMILQDCPPYYVLGTSTFPESEMKREYRVRMTDFALSEMAPFWLYHPYADHINTHSEKLERKPEGSARAQPLSFVTLDFSKDPLTPGALSEVAEIVKERVSFDFTMHLIISPDRIEKKAVIKLLSHILKSNPFIGIRIVIESAAGLPESDITRKCLTFAKHLYAGLRFHRNYHSNKNIFWNFPGSRRVSQSVEIYWLLPRGFLPDALPFKGYSQLLRPLARLETGDEAEISPRYFREGLDLYISFSKYPSGRGIVAFLEKLCRMKRPGQHFLFSQLEIQIIWEEMIKYPMVHGDLKAAVFSGKEAILTTISPLPHRYPM